MTNNFNDSNLYQYPPFSPHRADPIWNLDSDYVIPVVSSVGNGPKGDKGDPLVFDDLTDEQMQKVLQDANYVGNKVEEATYITGSGTTTVIEIPIADFDQFDMLFVDIEGLDLHEGADYDIVGNNIILNTPITHSGAKVHFKALSYTLIDGNKTIENVMGHHDYDTVATMKLDTDIELGAICHTLGFNAKGDKGAAWYKVTDDAVATETDVISLDNGYFAIMYKDDESVNPEMLGVFDYTLAEWAGTTQSYSKRTVVYWGSSAYTARQDVPTGIQITNEEYWVPWVGNEALHLELERIDDKIDEEIETRENAITAEAQVRESADAKIDTFAKMALNELSIAPIGVLSLDSEYLNTAFTGVTPQGIATKDANTIIVAVSQLSSTPELFGVDFIEININSSEITDWNKNLADLTHINDMAFNQANGKLYVADQNKIFILDGNYDIDDVLSIPCTGIAYDYVTQKMYIYNGSFYEFDYVNNTVSAEPLFTYSTASIKGYGGFKLGGLFQGFDVYDGKFVFEWVTLAHGCAIVIYENGIRQSVTPLNFSYDIYTQVEAQGLAITNTGEIICHGRVKTFQSEAYDLIGFVNNKNNMVYSEVLPRGDTASVSVNENKANASIGNMFATTGVKTINEAIAYCKRYGIDTISLASDCDFNLATNTFRENINFQLGNHTLNIGNREINLFGNVAFRSGKIAIDSGSHLRNWGMMTASVIEFSTEDSEVMRNNALLCLYNSTVADGSANLINCQGRGIVIGGQTTINAFTYSNVGYIKANVII